MKSTSETVFETAIDSVLLANGYACIDGKGFDHEQAIFPDKALHP